MRFRFLGTECEIDGVAKLTEFGEVVELPDDLAREIIAPLKGAALLPEPLFATVGFTAEELREFRWPSSHAEAPATFTLKKRAGLQALHDLRLRLQDGGPFEVTEGGE